MLDQDKFTSKFNAKVASVQKDVLSLSKLAASNNTLLTEDHEKELAILEGLLSSLQEFVCALIMVKEESTVTPAPETPETPAVAPTDPQAEGS